MRKWKKAFITLFVLCVAVLVFFSIPKQQRMSIVFACNDKYVPHVGTAITSILMNADKDDKFDFYILQDDISEENKQKFEELKRIKDFNIKFIQVDKERFKDFHSDRFTHYAYYRYIIPEIIREKKALYLDSDVIVMHSLKSLWNKEMDNNYALVVRDMLDQQWKRNFNLSFYFNSGVLLLNLDKMRSDNITKKLFQKTLQMQNKQRTPFSAQDVLNVVFDENVFFIHPKYNELNNINERGAVIFHFTPKWKPVTKLSEASKVYWHYRQLSPWAKEKHPIAIKNKTTEYLWIKDKR